MQKAPDLSHLTLMSHGSFIWLSPDWYLHSPLLSIAGRAPNTKRLNLDAAGVEIDEVGAIKVTKYLFFI